MKRLGLPSQCGYVSLWKLSGSCCRRDPHSCMSRQPFSWVPSHSLFCLRDFGFCCEEITVPSASNRHMLPLHCYQFDMPSSDIKPSLQCLRPNEHEVFTLIARGRTTNSKVTALPSGCRNEFQAHPPGRRSGVFAGVQCNGIGRGYRSEVGRLWRVQSSLRSHASDVKRVLLRAFLGVHPGLHAVAALSIPSCRVACSCPTTQATKRMDGWLAD